MLLAFLDAQHHGGLWRHLDLRLPRKCPTILLVPEIIEAVALSDWNAQEGVRQAEGSQSVIQVEYGADIIREAEKLGYDTGLYKPSPENQKYASIGELKNKFRPIPITHSNKSLFTRFSRISSSSSLKRTP